MIVLAFLFYVTKILGKILSWRLAGLLLMVGLVAGCGLTSGLSATPTVLQRYVTNLSSIDAGLDRLDSYRATLIVDLDGELREQPARGQIEALTEVVQKPAARHRYLTIQGDFPDNKTESSELYWLDQAIYLKQADEESWSRFTFAGISPEQFELLKPERLITLPAQVSIPPQRETLNDLSVWHYRFDQTDLSRSGVTFEQAQGEVWVAVEGNYVIQYVISTTMRVTVPDPQIDLMDHGSMILRYALSDLNADLAITLPVEAVTSSSPVESLPRLPDAEIISVFPSMIEYTSVVSPISATLFYRDQLSEAEWTEEGAAIFEEKARLTFSKENQGLTVIITPADNPSQIKVLLDMSGGNQGSSLLE